MNGPWPGKAWHLPRQQTPGRIYRRFSQLTDRLAASLTCSCFVELSLPHPGRVHFFQEATELSGQTFQWPLVQCTDF